jgi:DNA-binding CsgD family transcriptional regulator
MPARAGLARLVSMRLVQRQPGRPARFVATPPDIAITALVNERQADLDEARLAVPELLAVYQQSTATNQPGSALVVFTGADVGHRRFLEIQAAATTELLVFDRVSDRRVTGEVEVRAEAPVLKRGVRTRAIYEASSLDIPDRLPHVRRLAMLGEHARVAATLPMKLVICDRRLAMLPLTGSDEQIAESVVLVGPSALLEALIEIFEVYWQNSVPIPAGMPRAAGGLSAEQHEVLQLLTTGLKDEAIARQLGTSMRTTRRRIAGLLAALGVATRFQAGVEATRRGLL